MQARAHYKKHKAKIRKYRKAYYEKNKEEKNRKRRLKYAENPEFAEKIKAQAKVWRDANKEQVKLQKIKSAYGLSAEEYNTLYMRQNGCCAICGVATELVVDHDHETGQVRGLLCSNCNHLLGKAYDDCEILRQAIRYINKTRR